MKESIDRLENLKFILIKRQNNFYKRNSEFKGQYNGKIFSLERRIKYINEKIIDLKGNKTKLSFLTRLIRGVSGGTI